MAGNETVGSSNRCPICDRSPLLPFAKRLSSGEEERIAACGNEQCGAVFRLLPDGYMWLAECRDTNAMEKYLGPMRGQDWLAVLAETRSRRSAG